MSDNATIWHREIKDFFSLYNVSSANDCDSVNFTQKGEIMQVGKFHPFGYEKYNKK